MFESLNTAIVDSMGPMGPLILVGGLGLLLILITLPILLKKRAEPFDKLKALAAQNAGKDKGRSLRAGSRIDKLEKFASFLEPKSAAEMSSARMQMLRAGYPGKGAVRLFHLSKLVLGIGFLIIGMIYTLYKASISDVPLTTQSMIFTAILPAGIGYYLPIYWVTRRVETRKQEIIAGFPDALDLMLVCVEAGQSLDQSINRVAREMRLGYPALAEEFDLVANEVKAGKERTTVLRDMAERVGVPDVASFVTTLIQSATFGTSVAEALRVYSAEMRDKRIMRAEEKANKLPTKLTLGTMLFTVPPLLIILIGPSIVGIGATLAEVNAL
ncbi:type II secretion system F family protein [Neogemmobacter tilapiae]|uniref:Pilus assembly protein TadC n=1 Tax=Neogemmobacter tilapiae TaxID=875041 RepID=A0A918TIZ7_9RHOB|nr:type II secretion system F family protein [Gemmobacter tilapiae]GHC49219.1 pilus assembly protein TadC [Gemmobacter tilapiae]